MNKNNIIIVGLLVVTLTLILLTSWLLVSSGVPNGLSNTDTVPESVDTSNTDVVLDTQPAALEPSVPLDELDNVTKYSISDDMPEIDNLEKYFVPDELIISDALAKAEGEALEFLFASGFTFLTQIGSFDDDVLAVPVLTKAELQGVLLSYAQSSLYIDTSLYASLSVSEKRLLAEIYTEYFEANNYSKESEAEIDTTFASLITAREQYIDAVIESFAE